LFKLNPSCEPGRTWSNLAQTWTTLAILGRTRTCKYFDQPRWTWPNLVQLWLNLDEPCLIWPIWNSLDQPYLIMTRMAKSWPTFPNFHKPGPYWTNSGQIGSIITTFNNRTSVWQNLEEFLHNWIIQAKPFLISRLKILHTAIKLTK